MFFVCSICNDTITNGYDLIRLSVSGFNCPCFITSLEEAFAVVGWTAAISSITAPPAPAADAATRSPDPAAKATTFPGGGAAIARTGTAGAPPATRAGAARQHADAFS